LRIGREEDLRVRVYDEHLLSEGGIVRVEREECTTGLEDREDS